MGLTTALALVLVLVAGSPAGAAWEPAKPIEFVVPAGTGGGADQMARLISGIAEKHKLSPRPAAPAPRDSSTSRGRRAMPTR